MTELRRESPFPMVSIETAQQMIMTHCAPLGSEQINALFAEGRVLAEAISSPENIPDVPKASMDGYAIRADDGIALRRVIAEVTAGQQPGLHIGPGEAARIMTGAPLPSGADAMIQVELTEEHDGVMQIAQPIKAGNNVHTVGQDIQLGEAVLGPGALIGSAEVGLLATLGITRVQVYRRPIVAVLATGDEVVEPDAPREAGGVRDSNRYAIMAAVREAGCEAVQLGIAPDELALQREAIRAGLERADVLITSGGVSMGTRDLIKPILAELGTIHFGRIAFKPGKPTTFATVGNKLVFGLPGYPVSSLVSFEVFVRPALRALMGDARPQRPRVQVLLWPAPSAPRPTCQSTSG
jgi:molybdopterin molybdotransferase